MLYLMQCATIIKYCQHEVCNSWHQRLESIRTKSTWSVVVPLAVPRYRHRHIWAVRDLPKIYIYLSPVITRRTIWVYRLLQARRWEQLRHAEPIRTTKWYACTYRTSLRTTAQVMSRFSGVIVTVAANGASCLVTIHRFNHTITHDVHCFNCQIPYTLNLQ